MTTFYDSVALSFPSDAENFFAYMDGANTSQNYAEVVKMFPGKLVIPISTIGTPGIPVYDMEWGDLTPAGAAKTCYVEVSNSRRPTVYLSLAKWNDLIAALKTYGLEPTMIDYGIADWTGKKHLVPGSVFTQWANPDTSGGNWDISEVSNTWIMRILGIGKVDDMGNLNSTWNEVTKEMEHSYLDVNGDIIVISVDQKTKDLRYDNYTVATKAPKAAL